MQRENLKLLCHLLKIRTNKSGNTSSTARNSCAVHLQYFCRTGYCCHKCKRDEFKENVVRRRKCSIKFSIISGHNAHEKKTSLISRLRYCAMPQSKWSYTGARRARHSVTTINNSTLSSQIPTTTSLLAALWKLG